MARAEERAGPIPAREPDARGGARVLPAGLALRGLAQLPAVTESVTALAVTIIATTRYDAIVCVKHSYMHYIECQTPLYTLYRVASALICTLNIDRQS